MSSNGNPREYIQRRGRVLRRFEGKDFATIFDFIVTPGESSGNYIDTEINVFKDEYKRFYEFSKYSLNHKDNMELIMDIVNRYNIDINGSENNDQ